MQRLCLPEKRKYIAGLQIYEGYSSQFVADTDYNNDGYSLLARNGYDKVIRYVITKSTWVDKKYNSYKFNTEERFSNYFVGAATRTPTDL